MCVHRKELSSKIHLWTISKLNSCLKMSIILQSILILTLKILKMYKEMSSQLKRIQQALFIHLCIHMCIYVCVV